MSESLSPVFAKTGYSTLIVMKMIHRIYTVLVLALLILVTGCQKEIVYEDIDRKPPVTKYTIPGGWEGKFGRGTDLPNLYFAAHFKVDQSVTVQADDPPAFLFGNWQLVGDSVKTIYTFPAGDSFEFAAKFTDTVRRIEGYWRAIAPATGGGNFYLEKY